MFFIRPKKVQIAPVLFNRLKLAALRAGYASVQEFIEHALEQAVERIENEAREQTADRQQIDQQLRGLGYLE